MNQPLKLVFCLMISLLCASTYAAQYTLSTGTSIEADLPSNEPQVFSNFLLWKVKGNCEIISQIEPSLLSFKMLTNKGTLNGVEFSAGDSLTMTVNSGQKFELSADPRAKVEIINHGTSSIRMRCTST